MRKKMYYIDGGQKNPYVLGQPIELTKKQQQQLEQQLNSRKNETKQVAGADDTNNETPTTTPDPTPDPTPAPETHSEYWWYSMSNSEFVLFLDRQGVQASTLTDAQLDYYWEVFNANNGNQQNSIWVGGSLEPILPLPIGGGTANSGNSGNSIGVTTNEARKQYAKQPTIKDTKNDATVFLKAAAIVAIIYFVITKLIEKR